jgi:hypothetical protein
VRNGLFTASGDHVFTWADLEALQDGVTTSGGVTISGVNSLVVNLSQRIKVDGIRLYASDLTKSSDIYFYYKNTEAAEYTLLSTDVSTYYYTTVPNPSAPLFVKVTISGVSLSIYEFEVLNDDVIVSFGTTGEDYASYIEDAPVGTVGEPKGIPIYNNSSDSMPADAYVCVDRTGNAADFYVEISSAEEGTYYDLTDGALISDNDLDSTYTWNMGSFSNTAVDGTGGYVKLVNNTSYFGTVPLITPTYSFNVSDHCWDYDRINDKIYAIGSDGILKLWEFKYMSNTWSYIGEVKPGSTGHALKASMCYLNGYIYCLVDGYTTFGRYNLSGAVNNWEALTSPGTPVLSVPACVRRTIVSDRSRYIYCILAWSAGTGTNLFQRYDTTTSGWTTLSGSYAWSPVNNDWAVSCSLAYDNDNGRNYVYAALINGNSKNIQRYSINDNTWNTTYLPLISITPSIGQDSFVPMSYFDGNMWFIVSRYTNKIYRYNIDNATVYTYSDVPFSIYSTGGGGGESQYAGHLIAITNSRLFAAHLQDNRSKYSNYPIIGVVASGIYTTPIFSLDNAYNASYLTDESVTASGTTSISYNANSYNGSIRVKSSNTTPMVANEVYYGLGTPYINKWIPYNGLVSSVGTANCYRTSVDRRTGYTATVVYSSGYHNYWAVLIFDRTFTQIYRIDDATSLPYDRGFGFDKVGGIWGYTSSATSIHHYSSSLIRIATVYQSGTDFVHALVPEWDDEGCWYTDKIYNTLVHLNSAGTTLHTIALRQPRSLCATTDNGCWVADSLDYVAKRYDSDGLLVKTVDLDSRVVSYITHDYSDGFWYASGNYVYHVTSEGVEDLAISYNQPGYLCGSIDGCFVCRNVSGDYYIHFIDFAAGGITRTLSTGASTRYGISVFSTDVDSSTELHLGNSFVPASYDPIWSTSSGSLQWQEVSKDGYFLPKHKYVQAEYTLRSAGTTSPELHSIILAPAVKVEDIQPNSYKNAYVRTNIPDGVDIADYETRLKAWFGREE